MAFFVERCILSPSFRWVSLTVLSSQWPEKGADILHELLWLFRVGKVAACGHDGPALEIVILLGPAFRWDE
jgi:hypothetical protein